MVKKQKLKKSLNNVVDARDSYLCNCPFILVKKYAILYLSFLQKLDGKSMLGRRKGLNFNHKRRKISGNTIREIALWLFGIFAATFLAFVVVYCLGMTTSMIGISMEPSLMNGEKILVDRFSTLVSSPKRDDVIVFMPNGNQSTHYYVKRVVGVPGDTVQILDGLVFINGSLVEDDEDFDKIAEPGLAENEITLGKGEYFVLGDNRNNSEDSRFANIGIVERESIVGKVWFHLGASGNRLGFIN